MKELALTFLLMVFYQISLTDSFFSKANFSRFRILVAFSYYLKIILVSEMKLK